MARLVFTTLGSLGDLYPMIPVAGRLRARGHELVFALPAHLAPSVVAEGYACHPIAMPDLPGPSPDRSPEEVRARIRQHVPALLANALTALGAASAGADLIVTHQMQVSAAITARRLKLPWVTLTMFPGFIPSGYTVPQPHWLPALPTPAGRLVNRLTWRIFRYGLRYLSGDVISDAARDSGLIADDDVFMPGGLSPYLTIVLSSPRYSPPEPDWPETIRVVGYSEWDEPSAWADPPRLLEFLAGGEPPVLLMTSSANERDASGFFRTAARAVAGTGRRGLALLGTTFDALGVPPGDELAPGVAAWRYVPLSRVLDRCVAVVHHAGIGTTLTTIRHGRPAIGIPATFDQWYNAGRIKALGVGRVLDWKHYTPEALVAQLEALLADRRYTERAGELGALIATESGAAGAADAIEAQLAARQSC